MDILHVINDLDPSGGGPPLVASRLAASQAAEGHRAHILCYATPAAEERIAKDLAVLPGAGLIQLHTLPPADRAERLFTKRARAALAGLLPQVDVAHLHGVWEPILRATSVVARKTGTPYVVAPHGMLDEWALSTKRLKKKLALAIAYRAMLKNATLMHALSRHERECLAGGGYTQPVAIIPNGVFLQEFDPLPPPGDVHQRIPQLGGAPYILFLARLHPVKGLDLLAEAVARLAAAGHGTHAVIAGPDFGAEGPLREQVRRLGIEKRFHIVGPVYGADKRGLLAGADLFCLPSAHEGFSMSIAEALACRVPVVITEECHFPEVAEAGAGTVVKRTVEDLTRGLKEIIADPSRGRKMSEAGRKLIDEQFNWPRVARRSIEAYESAGIGWKRR